MSRRWLPWLLASSAAVAVVGAWLGATPEGAAPEPAAAVSSVAVSKASIVIRHRGQKQAEIASERVEVSTDGRHATFTGAPSAVWFDGGKPAMTATGRRIVFDRERRDVTVEGDLRITTVQGYTLRASSATWHQEARVVDLTGGVVATAAQAAMPAPTPAGLRSPAGPDTGQGRLRADRVRYDARARVVVATGNVSLVVGDLEIRADSLRLEQGPQIVTAEGRVVVRQREASLTAPVLRYSLLDATAEVTGGAVLTHADVTIKAPRMRFDLREEVTIAEEGVEVTQAGRVLTAASFRFHARTGAVTADGNVKLAQPGSTLAGRRLAGNFRDRRVEVWDDVVFIRAPDPSPARADDGTGASGDEMTVRAGRVAFRWDTNEAEAEERVAIRQRQRTAWADRLTYSEPSNRLVLTGRVVLEQQNGERPAGDGAVLPPRDPAAGQAPGGATRVTCTRLVMTLRERDIVLEGPLRVTQKDRWATGDRGAYTEATRRLVVSGNVIVQDADGRRLQADRVMISLADETFEAEGNVQTQFLIRPSPTRRP